MREGRSFLVFFLIVLLSGQAFAYACVNSPEADFNPFNNRNYSRLGFDVDMDNNVIIVGAPMDAQGNVQSGRAYVQKFYDDQWYTYQILSAPSPFRSSGDKFGTSVAIDGHWIVVGDIGENNGLGAVYIYRYENEVWNFKQRLDVLPEASNEAFGVSVAIDGNWIVVGASGRSEAFVYRLEGNDWVLNEALLAPQGFSSFGSSVSIKGNKIVVGAPRDGSSDLLSSGAAYLYNYDGSGWGEPAKIKPSDLSAQDWFGLSVSINDNFIAVGNPFDDDSGANSGSVYLFNSAGVIQAKLFASDGQQGEEFGYSLDLSEIGNSLIVGADKWNGEDGFGSRGKAYYFRSEENSWAEKTTIKQTDTDSADGNSFGISVSLDEDYAIVGAPFTLTQQGRAYLFDVSCLQCISSDQLTSHIEAYLVGEIGVKPLSERILTHLNPDSICF